MAPRDRSNSKEPNVDPQRFRTEDILAHILYKAEGSDKILKDMKTDFSLLNQTVTSHSISIK